MKWNRLYYCVYIRLITINIRSSASKSNIAHTHTHTHTVQIFHLNKINMCGVWVFLQDSLLIFGCLCHRCRRHIFIFIQIYAYRFIYRHCYLMKQTTQLSKYGDISRCWDSICKCLIMKFDSFVWRFRDWIKSLIFALHLRSVQFVRFSSLTWIWFVCGLGPKYNQTQTRKNILTMQIKK